AGVASVVVADDAVVDRQLPRFANAVLHGYTAAVGGGDVIGDDHVVQHQAGIALVADAATRSRCSVAGGGDAVGDREALHGHAERRCRVGRVEQGVDVEDTVEVVAIDGDGSSASVNYCQVAVQDFERPT